MLCFLWLPDLVASDLHRDGVMVLFWVIISASREYQVTLLLLSLTTLEKYRYLLSSPLLSSDQTPQSPADSQSGLEDCVGGERERDQRLAAGWVLNTADVREMDWLAGL